MDGEWFDFRGLAVKGDIAFDEKPCVAVSFKTDYNTWADDYVCVTQGI